MITVYWDWVGLHSVPLSLISLQHRDDGQPTYNVINVWRRNITGAGVVVAVVDEGFNPKHPEIEPNYVRLILLNS